MDLVGLFKGCQPHIALRNGRASETEYWRCVIEWVMGVVLPEEERRSDCVVYLLREVLVEIVCVKWVETICDPDYLNLCLLAVRVCVCESWMKESTTDCIASYTGTHQSARNIE